MWRCAPLGPRYGYIVGAIASGFASSTVTVAAMGGIVERSRSTCAHPRGSGDFDLAQAQMALILGAVEQAAFADGLAAARRVCHHRVVGQPVLPRRQRPANRQVGGAFDLKLARSWS